MASAAGGQTVVGKDKIFIRFTNLRTDGAGIAIRLNVVPNHNRPFTWSGKTIWVGGAAAGENRGALDDKWIASGRRSPWVDIGRFMNRRGPRSPDTYLSPVLCGVWTADDKPGLHLLAEVAEGRGIRVVRRVQVHKPKLKRQRSITYPWVLMYGCWNKTPPALPTLGLLIPSRLEIAARIYTLEEAMQWQLDFIEEFPK